LTKDFYERIIHGYDFCLETGFSCSQTLLPKAKVIIPYTAQLVLHGAHPEKTEFCSGGYQAKQYCLRSVLVSLVYNTYVKYRNAFVLNSLSSEKKVKNDPWIITDTIYVVRKFSYQTLVYLRKNFNYRTFRSLRLNLNYEID
jgi:hypothetical protein